MKLWKKLALGSAVVLSAVSLTACSNNKSSSNESKSDKQLTLWVDTARVSWYKGVVKDFEKEHPNIKVKVTQNPNGSANAKTDVGKDPSKAADVFGVPNDQLGQMADSGYINPLSPSDTKEIKKIQFQKHIRVLNGKASFTHIHTQNKLKLFTMISQNFHQKMLNLGRP